MWDFGVPWSAKRWLLKIIQVTMKHDSFDTIEISSDFKLITSILFHRLQTYISSLHWIPKCKTPIWLLWTIHPLCILFSHIPCSIKIWISQHYLTPTYNVVDCWINGVWANIVLPRSIRSRHSLKLETMCDQR